MKKPPFSKILVANRGEIAIRVLRAAYELGIETVAIFSHEDRYSLHRYKADEAYQIGEEGEALAPYLNIEEIVHLAKQKNISAIHPGYGFLAENVKFVRACQEAGICFIGPSPDVMEQLGGKLQAKVLAKQLSIPVIEDSPGLQSLEEAKKFAKQIGLPVIIKASAGGGGRGMRVVRDLGSLPQDFEDAKNEALRAFGDGTVFFEKFIEKPKHIEVQILGDKHGNVVHLFERDCSVQRRFQKVVEIAPSPNLRESVRQQILGYAVQLSKHVNYDNAGTVEFLVDGKDNVYFIEVNPRIQVEHTVTEEVTGIDIVRAQIYLAAGEKLSSDKIGIKSQQNISCWGFALQCRITTENPENNFQPDYGTLAAYRSPGGMGIRLDAGSAHAGATISPFFDSLLVKVTASGASLDEAASRMYRALQEFRIRGIRTNIPFLINVINHPGFRAGNATVAFLEENPELFVLRRTRDRATKVLKLLAERVVNGNADIKAVNPSVEFRSLTVPCFNRFSEYPQGSRDLLKSLGRTAFLQELKEDQRIHYTDTTFRDAHQSLLATRVRTLDMLRVAESFAKHHPEVFSMEVWGGATFDVALRFLNESPWHRLAMLREKIPNILFQMLFRGTNAVGYSAYPDNLISRFVVEAWKSGIDIFRIFDSMNSVDSMKLSIKVVNEETDGLAEACICYTGDICNPKRSKFNLAYYLDLAKQLEQAGAHIIAIKDMAGLLKPDAATLLISELKKTVACPIHLHTHDTSSLQSATYLKAIDAGVDVVDVALASMSGLTSQPNFNSIVAMLQGHERENTIDLQSLNKFSDYWDKVREVYYPFESGLKSGTAAVFDHEIPGGQYSNLAPQARALGLLERFDEVIQNYIAVDRLLGELIKVTPSSKIVGDFALYLTSNNLTVEDVRTRGHELSYPESLKSFFKGELGIPYGGFPEDIQKIVLRGEKPLKGRPNDNLAPIDFEKGFVEFQNKFGKEYEFVDFLSQQLYPKVFEDYHTHRQEYGEVWFIPTVAFFYGIKLHQEMVIELTPGKVLVIELLHVGEVDELGVRSVVFNLNGQNRAVDVRDNACKVVVVSNKKASAAGEIGSPLQGKLSKVLVAAGDKVEKEQALFVIEAMKMETTVSAPIAGTVSAIELQPGVLVKADDLVVTIAG